MEDMLIASFRSRQAVMRLHGRLSKLGIKNDILSTPRQVAVGCGLSVGFSEKDLNKVRPIAENEYPEMLIGFYRVRNLGNRLHVTPV